MKTERREKCWAGSLRNCSDKTSREHIVSACILSPTVRIQGFSWCKDTPKEIGKENLTVKNLCTKHNSELARFDAVANSFIGTMKSVFEIREAQQSPAYHGRSRIDHQISGWDLERWLCKTLINVCNVNEPEAELSYSTLTEHVFGGTPFEKPYGLSFAVKTGDSGDWNTDSVSLVPLFEPDGGRILVGCLATIRSLKFVFLVPGTNSVTSDNQLPIASNYPDWEGCQLNWHNEQILVPAIGIRRQRIRFSWEPNQ